jgi:hypothetical protein
MSGVVGIDPGNEGALVLLSDARSILDIADMPCVADGTRGRQTVNPGLLAAITAAGRLAVRFANMSDPGRQTPKSQHSPLDAAAARSKGRLLPSASPSRC